jgi:hypothetical protein
MFEVEQSKWLAQEQKMVGHVESLEERVQQLEAQVAATEQNLRQTVQVGTGCTCVSTAVVDALCYAVNIKT